MQRHLSDHPIFEGGQDIFRNGSGGVFFQKVDEHADRTPQGGGFPDILLLEVEYRGSVRGFRRPLHEEGKEIADVIPAAGIDEDDLEVVLDEKRYLGIVVGGDGRVADDGFA